MSQTDLYIPNKRGRPKGVKNFKSIVQEFAATTHTVQTPDGPREVTAVEFILMLLRQHQLKGHEGASKVIEELNGRFYQANEHELGLLVVPEVLDAEEWARRAEIKNQFRDQPPDPFK